MRVYRYHALGPLMSVEHSPERAGVAQDDRRARGRMMSTARLISRLACGSA